MLELRPGFTINNQYQIDSQGLIGGGGQSYVYKGQNLYAPREAYWQKNVFIKQYSRLRPSCELVKHMNTFYADAKIKLNDKSHYVCLPIETLQTSDSIVSIFPNQPGDSLQDLISHNKIEEKDKFRIAMAICNAVRVLHSQGIYHRDLKLDNIMVKKGRDGQYYITLIDFDGAKIVYEEPEKKDICLFDEVIGSPRYQSPEHIGLMPDIDVNDLSDVFTLGIILCEVLFGFHPFGTGENYEQKIYKGEFVIPTKSSLPHELVKTIYDCLSPSPYSRPTSRILFSKFHKTWSSINGESKLRPWDCEFYKSKFSKRKISEGFIRKVYIENDDFPPGNITFENSYLTHLSVNGTRCTLTNCSDAVIRCGNIDLYKGETVILRNKSKIKTPNHVYKVGVAKVK